MTKCGECSHSDYCSADYMIKGNDFSSISCYSAINGAFLKIFDELFSLNIVKILNLNGKNPKTVEKSAINIFLLQLIDQNIQINHEILINLEKNLL